MSRHDLAPWAIFFTTAFLVACLLFGATGCLTPDQKQKLSADLTKIEAKLKVDGQKAEAILAAVAKNAPTIVTCSAAVIASTAAAISTGDLLGLITGWACIPFAAKQLYADIKAGLKALPPLDAVQLAQQIHATVEVVKQAVAPILAPAPIPLPPPGLPAPLINP